MFWQRIILSRSCSMCYSVAAVTTPVVRRRRGLSSRTQGNAWFQQVVSEPLVVERGGVWWR